MKICFMARIGLGIYPLKLYESLKSLDSITEVGFIVCDHREANRVKKNFGNDENIRIHIISDYIESIWNNITLEDFYKLEEKYNCSPLWKYIYMDRFLVHQKYDYAVKMTTALFKFWESLFDNTNYEYYYDEVPATLLTITGVFVSRVKGVRYLSHTLARGELQTQYHYILNDLGEDDFLLTGNWKTLEYTKNEYEYAEQILEHFENKEVIPSIEAVRYAKKSLDYKYLSEMIPRYIIRSFSKRWNNPYSYIYYKQAGITFDRLKFRIRYQCIKKYYSKPDFAKKYLFFPLHYQPEAVTLVCSQKYERQLYFIDSIAKSLPADTCLYLKEHYVGLGHRDLSFYEELKKYPNVVLIDPWVDSRKLIIQSEAVITLTGTVAWEAMLLRKPAFVCGNVFFKEAPGLINVEDIYGNYVDKLRSWNKPSREDVIKYICYLMKGMFIGSADNDSPGDQMKRDSAENVKLLADSLFKVIKGIENGDIEYKY